MAAYNNSTYIGACHPPPFEKISVLPRSNALYLTLAIWHDAVCLMSSQRRSAGQVTSPLTVKPPTLASTPLKEPSAAGTSLPPTSSPAGHPSAPGTLPWGQISPPTGP